MFLFFFYETKINLQSHEGRRRVYRRRGGRNSAVCIEEMDKFSGGKNIMIWARVPMHTKTPFIRVITGLTARRYQDDILRSILVSHIMANRNMTLAQDNVPCYTARTTQQFLEVNNFRVLPWPAKSHDLNPIEHIWNLAKRNVRALPALRIVIYVHHVWQQIGQPTIQRYILSKRQRCLAVIRARGGHIPY